MATDTPAPGRTLHLIDIENVFGLHARSMVEGALAERWGIYASEAVTHRRGDVVIAACGTGLAPIALFSLPSWVRKLIRSGKDGADLALIEAFDDTFAPGKFDRVVIASGDHIFSTIARTAAAAGAEVHLVIGVGAPAAELLATTRHRTYIRSRKELRRRNATAAEAQAAADASTAG